MYNETGALVNSTVRLLKEGEDEGCSSHRAFGVRLREIKEFYDKMFGWLGYQSFWTHNIGYLSTYYTAWFPFFHSYIGIQPAQTGEKLSPNDHATGIHHVALWAKNRKAVDDFYENFLLKNHIEVTDKPAEYRIYSPSYYVVFFNDPITGIHFELACTPTLATILGFYICGSVG